MQTKHTKTLIATIQTPSLNQLNSFYAGRGATPDPFTTRLISHTYNPASKQYLISIYHLTLNPPSTQH